MNLPFIISKEKQKEINGLKIIPKGRSCFNIGDKYNHLIILGRTEGSKKYNNTYVYAICDCEDHNIIKVQLNQLKTNHTISCGCEHRKKAQQQGINSYIDQLGKITGDFKVIRKTEERDSESIVWLCQCIHCGELRKISQRNMKNPNICSCQKKGGSSYERKIEKILKENNISFKREKIFDSFIYTDTQKHPRYDFFLYDLNCLIEIHGQQHYEQKNGFMGSLKKIQERDKIKKEWALNNNYKMIIIPYKEVKNISIKDLLPETSQFLIKEGNKNV